MCTIKYALPPLARHSVIATHRVEGVVRGAGATGWEQEYASVNVIKLWLCGWFFNTHPQKQKKTMMSACDDEVVTHRDRFLS